MGTRPQKFSDLTGVELQDNEVIVVTVKGAAKKFEASAEELKAMKVVSNVVELEYAYPSGQRETVLVSKTEFSKVVSDEKLASFPSNKGRQPGTSPKYNRASGSAASE